MKLSIITPSYNQGRFIERTIESVIKQKSKFELEYIIIDCESTDNSLDIIKSYSKKDKRIIYISEPDNGQSDGINKGFKRATGDIVAWINSDDEYTDNAFEKVYKSFSENPNIEWLYGLSNIIDENNNTIFPFITFYKKLASRNFSANRLLIENYICQPSVFFKKELIEKVGYLDDSLEYVMDYDLWLRFMKFSKPLTLKEYLSNFRLYKNSKTGSSYKITFNEGFEVAKKYTNNKLILFLHFLQVLRTVSAYRLIYFFVDIFNKLKQNYKA